VRNRTLNGKRAGANVKKKRRKVPKAESRARDARRTRARNAERRRKASVSDRIVERLLAPFADMFGVMTWMNVVALVTGVLLCFGSRTVSSALRILDGAHDSGFSRFHRLLAYTNWSELGAARRLLGILVTKFAPDGDLVCAADDTTERRKGPNIRAKGVFRDAVRSSRGRVAVTPGLRWLTIQMLVRPSFSSRVWGLPILTMHCPSDPSKPARQADMKAKAEARGKAIAEAVRRGSTAADAAVEVKREARKATLAAKAKAKAEEKAGGEVLKVKEQNGRPHRTLPQRTVLAMLLVARWMRGRTIVMVGDGSFACKELFKALAPKVVCVARCRMDVRLFGEAPPKTGKAGRPAKKGERQVMLGERLKSKDEKWTKAVVPGWNRADGKPMEVEYLTGTAIWSGQGGSLPVRWVLSRVVGEKRQPSAFLCTGANRDAEQILGWYAMRWAVEVTFQEARRHLGVETQRQWSDLAIRRATPCLFGFFSLVVLWASNLTDTIDPGTGKKTEIPVLASAWYRKREPTFSDCLAAVRRGIWSEERANPILWRLDCVTWREKARNIRNSTPFEQRTAENLACAA